jgi:chromosome partitioning protein
MTVISFINQKGGCGKSSTCFHLAGALAEQGQRVLLVDADPQGSLSQGFLGSTVVENLPLEATLAAAFAEEGCLLLPRQVVRPTGIRGIDLIPSNQHLTVFNRSEPETTGMVQFALHSLVADLHEWDVVLMDCPPNLYLCSWAALLAADEVVIPVPPEDFGTQGLRVVHQAIEQAQVLNQELRLLGHLVTRSDSRLLIHQAYERKLRQLYDAQVLETVIPEVAAFKVALAARTPVNLHRPRSTAARLTTRLVHEMVVRMNNRTPQRRSA